MKKMYISPRMETIVITSNVIATSGPESSSNVGLEGIDNGGQTLGPGAIDAPTRGGRF